MYDGNHQARNKVDQDGSLEAKPEFRQDIGGERADQGAQDDGASGQKQRIQEIPEDVPQFKRRHIVLPIQPGRQLKRRGENVFVFFQGRDKRKIDGVQTDDRIEQQKNMNHARVER